jgi:ABC-type antimicrobial peptide transport system permease subunit
VALGFFLASLGLHGIPSAVLGWTLEFHVSAFTVFATIAIGLITGTCASALAAYQSARTSISEALSGA